jgi:two-component system nitrogen regulation response regulator GlnG
MRHFLKQAAQELGGEIKNMLPETMEVLQRLQWPGNVRQLKNTALWLTVMASSQEIHPEDLPPELLEHDPGHPAAEHWHDALRSWSREWFQQGQTGILDTALPALEAILIEAALEQTGGRRLEAAQLLGWGRNTLTRKIKELRLELT